MNVMFDQEDAEALLFSSWIQGSATIWVSCGPKAAVGSSMIRILALKYTARAMATDLGADRPKAR